VTHHKIIRGDSRHMQELADKSAHLVITSPPYWQLKDYGTPDQIGFNDSYENYINHLNLVWSECHRVLANGCRLCINIGDQFARAAYYGRYKVIPIRTEIIKFCESMGFDYMGAIIWQKKTTTNTTGGASIMGSFPTPRNGILSIDYEFILLFKKLGKPIKPTPEQKETSRMTKEEWREYFAGHWSFRGAKQDGHIAMFPEELPHRLIKMFAYTGDTVLDPFMGSGTTATAAQKLGRNSVGYEINPEFIPFIKKKVNVEESDSQEITSEFVEQGKLDIDFSEKIKTLPYIFSDPHILNAKIDMKSRQFGSKIDKDSKARETYFSVKEIITPELIRLNDDSIIRLIGIKTNEEKQTEALEFLRLKTDKQKVYLRFDEREFDEQNQRYCYLYLKNKTFLNAHLIKHGFVDVDASFSYKNQKKFLKLEN